MSLCDLCAWYPGRPEDGMGPPGAGITDVENHHMGVKNQTRVLGRARAPPSHDCSPSHSLFEFFTSLLYFNLAMSQSEASDVLSFVVDVEVG